MAHQAQLHDANQPLSAANDSAQNSARALNATSSTTPGAIPASWADALIAKFHAIWGSRWHQHVAGVAPDALAAEWADGLFGLTGEQLRRGIDHCRANMPWPPSIAEFRAACMMGERSGRPEHRTADVLLLPPRTWGERRADGLRHIGGLVAALRDGGSDDAA